MNGMMHASGVRLEPMPEYSYADHYRWIILRDYGIGTALPFAVGAIGVGFVAYGSSGDASVMDWLPHLVLTLVAASAIAIGSCYLPLPRSLRDRDEVRRRNRDAVIRHYGITGLGNWDGSSRDLVLDVTYRRDAGDASGIPVGGDAVLTEVDGRARLIGPRPATLAIRGDKAFLLDGDTGRELECAE